MTMDDAQNTSSLTMADLPNDCLVIIFERLRCAAERRAFGSTCRSWREILHQNQQSLQFDYCSSLTNKFDTCKVRRILARFPHLESLSLSWCTKLHDSGLGILQNYGTTLRTLHLERCYNVSDTGISFVAAGCRSLTYINLSHCNVTDSGLEVLSKGCCGLEVINLSDCSFVSDRGIRFLVKFCPKMNTVLINSCARITGVGFQGCSQNLAYLEAKSCRLKLKGITSIVSGGGLTYLNLSSPGWHIREDSLSAIGAGFATRLRVLNMRKCDWISDELVGEIAKGCPSLVEWNLSWCSEVSFGGWESISLNCHNLETLHVHHCLNLCGFGLRALANGCQKLSVLYMSGCPKVRPSDVDSFKLARGDVAIVAEETFHLPSDFRAVMYPSWPTK